MRMPRTTVCVGALLWLLAGCGEAATPDGTDAATIADSTTPDGVDAADATVVGGPLPCDVQQFLDRWCTACHGEDLKVGAPMALLDRGDFARPSITDPSVTMAEASVARLTHDTAPMPPIGVLEADVRAVFEAWVAAGFPSGECTDEPPPPPQLVCTSDTYWTGGVLGGGPLMKPGAACIDCHEDGNAPRLLVAGTVYPTVREPDDCNGAAGVTVEITDANGDVLTMTTNAAGNFHRRRQAGQAFAGPATAKVIANGVERTMLLPVFSGDCNSCHTEEGLAGAPGRIVVPSEEGGP